MAAAAPAAFADLNGYTFTQDSYSSVVISQESIGGEPTDLYPAFNVDQCTWAASPEPCLPAHIPTTASSHLLAESFQSGATLGLGIRDSLSAKRNIDEPPTYGTLPAQKKRAIAWTPEKDQTPVDLWRLGTKFTCNECGRRFAHEDALARHMESAESCAGRKESFDDCNGAAGCTADLLIDERPYAAVTSSVEGPSDSTKKDNSLQSRAPRHPPEAVEVLQKWLDTHSIKQYPTAVEKRRLAQASGLTFTQVSIWFSNARSRHRSPLDDWIASAPEGKTAMERSIANEWSSLFSNWDYDSQSLYGNFDYGSADLPMTPHSGAGSACSVSSITKALASVASNSQSLYGNFDFGSADLPSTPHSRAGSACSAFSQCNDAVMTLPPRRGRRKYSTPAPISPIGTQSQNPNPSIRKSASPAALTTLLDAGKFQPFFVCDCCPKKPKKFDTIEELNLHVMKLKYQCQYCPNRFKSKNEAERHQNSFHLRRHSWSCAALTRLYSAYHLFLRQGSKDVCSMCGEEFTRPPNWYARFQHMHRLHKFNECNQTKKFYRADHFRQHLKHSHAAKLGKWTDMLENMCMQEESKHIPQPSTEPDLNILSNKDVSLGEQSCITQQSEISFQCTFCHKQLSSKSWRRHEETMHLPQIQWICQPHGVPVIRNMAHSSSSLPTVLSHCVFCGLWQPEAVHFETCHRAKECADKPRAERAFARKDHLVQHWKNFHGCKLDHMMAEYWKMPINYSGHKWSCGFCGAQLANWEQRALHIPKHFREGLTMASWDSEKGRLDSVEELFCQLINDMG